MTSTCPDCGASVEFEQHEVRLRTGVCPSCAKEFAFVEGTTVSSRLGSPPATTPSGEEPGEDAAETAKAAEGPDCADCGSPLSFHEGPNGSLEVACEECETMTVFVPKPEHPRGAREERPRFTEEGPRGRPCRRCGNPLRFSTGEDGLLVGECDSCGNRFTLPPRADRGPPGRGGYNRPQRYGRREFRSGPGGRPPYRGRRPPRSFDGDDDRPRKRRRPRESE